MNKGNQEAALWQEYIAESQAVALPCEEPYYGDDTPDGSSEGMERLAYWHESRLASDAEYYWDDLVDYDRLWDFSDDEWAYRREVDDFAWDDSGVAGYYEAIWAAVGYIPRYIRFPFPVRAVVDGRLVDCYRP